MNKESNIVNFPQSLESRARINYLFSLGLIKWDLAAQKMEWPAINDKVEEFGNN